MKFLNIIIVALFVVVSACEKPGPGIKGPKCDNPPQKIYNPSAELTATHFKTGSYWIYVDSSQTVPGYDSARVTSFMDVFGKPYPEYCDSVQYIAYIINHWPQGPAEGFTIFFASIRKNAGCADYCGEKVYLPYGTTEDEPSKYQRTYYDSLFIYDRYYKKVQKTVIFNDPSENNSKVIYYMNSDEGFLRKEVYSKTNALLKKLLLVRKNIIK